MTQNEKTTLTPKLRFPEFKRKSAWTIKKLGELFQQREETGYENIRLLSLTDKEGIIPQEESNRKNGASADRSKYLRVVPGDIVYNTMRMWEGRSALAHIEGIVSPAYTVCTPRAGTNGLFFSYYFKTPQLIAQFARYSQGLVKDTLNLKFEAFAQIHAAIPIPAEQQKIAECLSALDELIEAESRKLDTLKAHKKGLMQQLFPRAGETRPRLRFPEFHSDPEWREATLGEAVDFESGGTPSRQNSDLWNGAIPWVTAKDMKQLFLDDTEDHITEAAIKNGARVAPAGTVLMLTRGMTLFKDVPICVLRRPMSFNQDVKALRTKGDLTTDFLPHLLIAYKQRLLDLVSPAGHGTGRINTDDIGSLNVRYPKAGEQKYLSACFTSLELLIVAQSEKLEALRVHKRGLMQQLFPSTSAIEP